MSSESLNPAPAGSGKERGKPGEMSRRDFLTLMGGLGVATAGLMGMLAYGQAKLESGLYTPDLLDENMRKLGFRLNIEGDSLDTQKVSLEVPEGYAVDGDGTIRSIPMDVQNKTYAVRLQGENVLMKEFNIAPKNLKLVTDPFTELSMGNKLSRSVLIAKITQ